MSISATDPMSGHDETAHVDMLHTASTNDVSKKDYYFYDEAYDYLEENDFFYLQQASTRKRQMPHAVLGHCGENFRPLSFYSKYFSWLNPGIESLVYSYKPFS